MSDSDRTRQNEGFRHVEEDTHTHTLTAMPLASVPKDAAEGQVLGTVCVLVSQMWIREAGIFSSRLAT